MKEYKNIAQLAREILCEAIGVFVLNFFCPYGILQLSGELVPGLPGIGPTVVIVSFLVTFIPMFAPLSGSHFNPLFSLVMYMLGKKSLMMAIIFMVTQMIASCLSALLLQATLIDGFFDQGVPYPRLNPKVSVGLGFFMESLATCFLVMLVTISIKSGVGITTIAVRIGLFIALSIHTLGPFTGAAMNPAVVFGPALIDRNGFFQRGWWIYYIAPYFGGLIGYLVGVFIDQGKEELQDTSSDSSKTNGYMDGSLEASLTQ